MGIENADLETFMSDTRQILHRIVDSIALIEYKQIELEALLLDVKPRTEKSRANDAEESSDYDKPV